MRTAIHAVDVNDEVAPWNAVWWWEESRARPDRGELTICRVFLGENRALVGLQSRVVSAHELIAWRRANA